MKRIVLGSLFTLVATAAMGDAPSVDARVAAVEPRVIAWRRDIHAHPELGNREFRTAGVVARHLESLGFEVRTGIAKTGVIGILRGARPGKVLALRADMDALPVAEETGLPFASRVLTEEDGQQVPVMHACGHDAHVAILMGAAEVLSGLRDQITGTILFVFQPAEEGAPAGEQGGAPLMLAEGALDDPRPDAIFALHVEPGQPGSIEVRPGPFLASATTLRIRLEGRQTHGGRPWEGTDLINLSADIVKSLTTISARQVNVIEFPNVVTVASIQAGLRENILPGTATLKGTIRTFSAERAAQLEQLIRTSVADLANSYGASAVVEFENVAGVTVNDPALLRMVLPALEQAAGPDRVNTAALLRGAAEDFSFFEERIPGLYYILGSTKDFTTLAEAPPNHSPSFDIDESVLAVGVRAQVLTALSYLRTRGGARP